MTTETDWQKALTEGERGLVALFEGSYPCGRLMPIIKRLGGEVVELQKDVDCEKDMRLVFSQKRIKKLEAENAELKAKLNEGERDETYRG